MLRVVADLGNSRMKWGRIGPDGAIVETVALAPDEPDAWILALEGWGLGRAGSSWAVASVNPPLTDALLRRLETLSAAVRLFRSAADVPVEHSLTEPERAGVDRALAVLAARRRNPAGTAGRVVSCGTAITVERIAPDGTWLGGAITPGLGLSSRALHERTAQLPRVAIPAEPPAPWGATTEPALRAGIFWGAVGGIRELLARQEVTDAWTIWTGGDAPLLAPRVMGEEAPRIVPDLVLEGLAATAFPPDPRP